MIVALDAQLTLGTATGIGEYVTGLAEALRAAGAGVVELREPKLDPWRFDRRLLWDQVLLPGRARASGAQVLHCASGTMPLSSPLPIVVTVHDVAWLKVQRHAPAYARYYFGRFAIKRYAAAKAIAVDSDFSRRELLDVMDVAPEHIHVVYNGVAADYCKIERQFPSDVILVPGTVERRKNLEVLIRALPLIGSRMRVVSAGPFTPYRDECLRLAESLGVRDRVEFRGYIGRAALIDLYAKCALVALRRLRLRRRAGALRRRSGRRLRSVVAARSRGRRRTRRSRRRSAGVGERHRCYCRGSAFRASAQRHRARSLGRTFLVGACSLTDADGLRTSSIELSIVQVHAALNSPRSHGRRERSEFRSAAGHRMCPASVRGKRHDARLDGVG